MVSRARDRSKRIDRALTEPGAESDAPAIITKTLRTDFIILFAVTGINDALAGP